MTDAAIQLRDVSYRTGGEFALDRLTLDVPRGSIYGFLGANGAGKSTTIRLIMGMLLADSGNVTVLGHEIPRDVVPALARVGYIPERPHLYQDLTVAEQMRFHAAFHKRWDPALAAQLLGDFGLRPDAVISRQSKGETGKLMMLLALAQRPDLLVLDEPTDGLDPVVRRDVFAALLDFVSRDGATVLISSHLVHELERFCDRIGVIDGGRLVADLPIDTLKAGIKRVRVDRVPRELPTSPFEIVERLVIGDAESWLVRGWEPSMTEWFDGSGAELKQVIDLDLEEGFVEMLGASRRRSAREG